MTDYTEPHVPSAEDKLIAEMMSWPEFAHAKDIAEQITLIAAYLKAQA